MIKLIIIFMISMSISVKAEVSLFIYVDEKNFSITNIPNILDIKDAKIQNVLSKILDSYESSELLYLMIADGKHDYDFFERSKSRWLIIKYDSKNKFYQIQNNQNVNDKFFSSRIEALNDVISKAQ